MDLGSLASQTNKLFLFLGVISSLVWGSALLWSMSLLMVKLFFSLRLSETLTVDHLSANSSSFISVSSSNVMDNSTIYVHQM